MKRLAVRLARRLSWPLRLFRTGYWMRLWLASTEQQARLLDRVRDLEAEAEALRWELRAAQAFAQDGYRQFREAQAKLDKLARVDAVDAVDRVD